MTDRQTTHAPGCWGWGPRHYECAVGQVERDEALLRQADALEQQAWPEVAGIGRDSEHTRAVVLCLRHEPSDAQPAVRDHAALAEQPVEQERAA